MSTKLAAALDPANAPVKKSRTKPGQHGLFVTLTDNEFHNLTESADGRPLNVWLSKLIGSTTVAHMVSCHTTKPAE